MPKYTPYNYQRNFNRGGSYRPQNNTNNNFRYSNHHKKPYDRKTDHSEEDFTIPKSPMEQKIEKFIKAVRNQPGIAGDLVFMDSGTENDMSLLQSAVDTANMSLNIQKEEDVHTLKIRNELLAQTSAQGKQICKHELCKEAMLKLKDKCFIIVKKNIFEEVTTKSADVDVQPQPETSTAMEGSKAHQMMMKMGWGGKGLGVNEQGEEQTVAEKMTQNISRKGLGNTDILKKVNEILTEFAHSNKVSTLALDSDFTKEERAEIHKLAQKLNLKTKSIGKDENRRITISKKMGRWDLVHELLRVGLENGFYKLVLPTSLENLWWENERTDNFK